MSIDAAYPVSLSPLTAYTMAPLATPYVSPATTPAQCVPWPSTSLAHSALVAPAGHACCVFLNASHAGVHRLPWVPWALPPACLNSSCSQ